MELRYIDPRIYGHRLLISMMSFLDKIDDDDLDEYNNNEELIRKFITRYGIFMILTFLEASRPFKDESLLPKRNDNNKNDIQRAK